MEKKIIHLIEHIAALANKKIETLIRNVKRLVVVTHQSLGNKIYINVFLSVLWFLVVCVCAVNWRDISSFFLEETWRNGDIWQNIIVIIILKYLLFYPILLLNIFILIPLLWRKKRYIYYLFCIPLLGLYLTAIKIMLSTFAPNKIPDLSHAILHTYFVETFNVVIIFIISSSIKYVYEDFAISARTLVLEKRNAQLRLQLAELRVAQLKPHFLLNSLNNIDTLLLKKSDKAGQALQGLSDTLKYVLYESDKQFLPLSSEIEHLENMTMLECLRFSEPPKITVKILGDTNGIMIPSLLLTPLLENSFKWMDNRNRWITIDVSISDENVLIVIGNSRAKLQKTKEYNEKKGGLGLVRLQERLKMLYPNQDEPLLIIQDKRPKEFYVYLKIPYITAA